MSAPAGTGTPVCDGFADPVRDAAFAFRAALDAMARPGRVVEAGAGLAPPEPFPPSAAATILTLVDADAPLWLPEAARGGPAETFLRFHCAAAPVPPEDAAFAFGRWADIAPRLGAFPAGTPERPDRSTTLLLAVDRLEEGEGAVLSGPGIDGTRRLDVALPPDFWAARAAAAFPLGHDVFLCCGARLAALPRTTRAEI
jgi:alpha-D-ribose 1-methylphosphonate 5-triphosphate synthase subunit PhnH